MGVITPKATTATGPTSKAEREKAQALHDLRQLASDYAEMRAKRDEYEAQMNNLSTQMQALCITHGISKERVGDYQITLVQGTSRTLDPKALLRAGVSPDVLDAAYTSRPTQYIKVTRARDIDE